MSMHAIVQCVKVLESDFTSTLNKHLCPIRERGLPHIQPLRPGMRRHKRQKDMQTVRSFRQQILHALALHKSNAACCEATVRTSC